MYRVEVCNSISDLLNRESEWLELENFTNNTNITSSYNWVKIFLSIFLNREDDQFGYNKKLLIIFLYRNNKLIAIAPFIKVDRKKYGFTLCSIEFIGQQWGATNIDLIGSNLSEEELRMIFSYLYRKEKFHVLQLKYIPQDTENFDVLSGQVDVLSASPYIPVNKYDDFTSFRNKVYSKSLKQNINTAMNRIAKQNLTLSVSSLDFIEDIYYDEIIRISNTKLNDGKRSLYLDQDKKKFVKEIVNQISHSVVFCEIDSAYVAYRLNFYYNNIKYCFDAAFDRNYKRFELGAISVELSLKESFERGVDLHSEGIGTDYYKSRFCTDVQKVYSFTQKGNKFLAPLLYLKIKKNQKKVAKIFESEIGTKYK